MRLRYVDRVGELPLGEAPLLPPIHQSQRHSPVSCSGNRRYYDSLYFVNCHNQNDEAQYKQMSYVIAMFPDNRLRELRKAAGLSQTQLAEASGVSQPYISQMENADGTTLDIARMRALSRILKCTPADLLAVVDNPDRLDDEERELIARYRASGMAQREMIRRVAEPLPVPAEPARRTAVA
nr:helix-turn-helix transcriptional regulator [Sphingomonas parapaucimobilis]